MKIALYIEDGLEQIVLTPELDTEKAILKKLNDGSRVLTIKTGQFFECRGGWMRYESNNEESTMIILRRPEPEVFTEQDTRP